MHPIHGESLLLVDLALEVKSTKTVGDGSGAIERSCNPNDCLRRLSSTASSSTASSELSTSDTDDDDAETLLWSDENGDAPAAPAAPTPATAREKVTTATANDIDSCNGRGSKRTVQFGSVRIRDYNRTVGDHPDCPLGPSLSLDWDYEEREPISVDEFESNRVDSRIKDDPINSPSSSSSSFSSSSSSHSSSSLCQDDDNNDKEESLHHLRRRLRPRPRRAPGNLNPVSSIVRKNLLHYEFGVPLEDLQRAMAEVAPETTTTTRKEKQRQRQQRFFGLRNRAREILGSVAKLRCRRGGRAGQDDDATAAAAASSPPSRNGETTLRRTRR